MQVQDFDLKDKVEEKTLWKKLSGFFSIDVDRGKSIKTKTEDIILVTKQWLKNILTSFQNLEIAYILPTIGIASLITKVVTDMKSASNFIVSFIFNIAAYTLNGCLYMFEICKHFSSNLIFFLKVKIGSNFGKFFHNFKIMDRFAQILQNQFVMYFSMILNATFFLAAFLNFVLDKYI